VLAGTARHSTNAIRRFTLLLAHLDALKEVISLQTLSSQHSLMDERIKDRVSYARGSMLWPSLGDLPAGETGAAAASTSFCIGFVA
jgi:hypothetical protein